jgi:hypothetical protein
MSAESISRAIQAYNSRMRPAIAEIGVSRRDWSKRLLGTLAVSPALAQVTQKVPPQGAPSPPPVPATPEQRLQKAYADIRTVSDQLSKIEVPMDLEPAFSFRPSI